MKKYESPLKRVKGLGSAKSGVQHWWHQRLTAIALLGLGLWFISRLIGQMIQGSLPSAKAFVGGPAAATLLILMLLSGFYHTWLGLQTVIEDYVHGNVAKYTLLVIVMLACILAASVGIFCIIFIAFKG